MQTITAYKSELPEAYAQDITAERFNDFVKWIDRSESTTRAYITNLRQFMTWLQSSGIARPDRDDIISYRDYLSASGRKPNTVRAYIRCVKQFFEWAAANNLYPNVAANVHSPKVDHTKHKKDALTVQEVLTVEQSIESRSAAKTAAADYAYKDEAGRRQRSTEQGKRLKAIYLLAVNAGLRTIEISRANVKDLETKGGNTWLYVWGKGRTEPDQRKALAPEVAAAIKDYLKSRTDNPVGSSPLFVSTGNRSKGKRIATTTISTMLKQALKDAGIDSERITAHSLRHTAGTAVMTMTGNLYQTQKYMRHSNPTTTEIYIHDNEQAQKQEQQTAQQLYNHYHGQQTSDYLTIESALQDMTPEQLKRLANVLKPAQNHCRKTT